MLSINRQNSLRQLLPLFLLIIAIAGCGRKERLYPFGWTKTDPAFDSLTVRTEYAFLEFEPDSVIEANVEKMKRLADADPSMPEKMSRYHYWHARLRLRHVEIDEAMDEFLVSLAMTDSARFPYDV
ncbi:MAG: hypothetical protein K2J70_00705, partial [Muribaculaceae bacterium]|nr:hypothetical protein [Muribaculaceae bacterium]